MSITRASFLKMGLLPLAAAGAEAARRLDPNGEPMREVDGQLIVNGDNVIVQNVSFRTGPTRAAVVFTEPAKGGLVRNSIVRGDVG